SPGSGTTESACVFGGIGVIVWRPPGWECPFRLPTHGSRRREAAFRGRRGEMGSACEARWGHSREQHRRRRETRLLPNRRGDRRRVLTNWGRKVGKQVRRCRFRKMCRWCRRKLA